MLASDKSRAMLEVCRAAIGRGTGSSISYWVQPHYAHFSVPYFGRLSVSSDSFCFLSPLLASFSSQCCAYRRYEWEPECRFCWRMSECCESEDIVKRVSLLVATIMLVASAAIAQDTRYNFDKNADFSKFKTYKWVSLKDAAKPNELMDKQIIAAVDSELATKGLSKVDGDNADLYVGYQAGIGQEKQFTSYNSDWGYGGGWYGGGWYGGAGGMSTTTGQTSTIYVGQLALDMYDSANKDLAWRGVVSKTLDQKAKPEKQEKNLKKAITKLLKNYPPPVKK